MAVKLSENQTIPKALAIDSKGKQSRGGAIWIRKVICGRVINLETSIEAIGAECLVMGKISGSQARINPSHNRGHGQGIGFPKKEWRHEC